MEIEECGICGCHFGDGRRGPRLMRRLIESNELVPVHLSCVHEKPELVRYEPQGDAAFVFRSLSDPASEDNHGYCTARDIALQRGRWGFEDPDVEAGITELLERGLVETNDADGYRIAPQGLTLKSRLGLS